MNDIPEVILAIVIRGILSAAGHLDVATFLVLALVTFLLVMAVRLWRSP